MTALFIGFSQEPAAAEPATAAFVDGCAHPRTRHLHGTRAAYVRDRCRCGRCTAANTAASNTRHRDRAYGRWAPFVDADPVRAHIHRLRAAGIGTDRIAALAGISPSQVRALIYPTRAGGLPTRRVRPETARRLLAVTAGDGNRAARSLVPATGSRRRLQALTATGWTLPQLGDRLARTPSNLRRTMTASRVTAVTATEVARLYERLWNTPPPHASDADRIAAQACRDDARRRGWLPPLAWDDIDTDAEPGDWSTLLDPLVQEDVDHVAVERAVTGGCRVTLTAAEELEAVRQLSERGSSLREIAAVLDSSSTTISRRRRRTTAA